MIAAFIDESEKADEFYFLGALVITQPQYFELRDALIDLKAEVVRDFPQVPIDFEYHAWEIMNGKGCWKKVPIRYRINVLARVLKATVAAGACVHIEGIDREKHKALNYKVMYPAREVAFNYLFEKIDRCDITCTPIEEQRYLVQVFADEHHTKKESTTNFTQYQQYGTWGYNSSKLKNLMSNMSFIDSKETYALQAVDCVTYLYNRVRTHSETDDRAQKAKDMLWSIVKPLFSGCSTIRVWP